MQRWVRVTSVHVTTFGTGITTAFTSARTILPLALVLGCATAAAPLAGCGSSAGLSPLSPNASARVTRDAALDEAIRSGMKRASVPGAIVGVWREGQPPYVRAFGVRDTASGEPMATNLSMRIGSNTKAFVATALLMLAERGKLGLDDPIDRYVKGVPSGDHITLRQLAQMRSGLFNYAADPDTSRAIYQQSHRQWTPQELLEASFRHPPLFPPGTDFDYSNTNTVLLGLVVEKISGQSLASFIEQNILKPEGLTRTVFPAGAEIPSPHSRGYYKMPDGKIVDATDWNPSWGWAAGNMISTLEDLRVWTRDLATGKLISPAMKQEQQQFLSAPPEGDGALYGLALENQNGWIGHNGNINSYMVYPYYLPSERMTLVVMLNSGADIPGSWLMMQDITRVISPNHVWPGLPKEEK
jgi:D-alanyl-D-alanine carboxypeptidase